MTEPLLQLRQLFAVYRNEHGDAAALQGVDLDLGAGEIVCVHGPSGAGKSTLLRVVAGHQQPAAGSVTLLGRDIGRLDSRGRALARNRYIGVIGQSSAALSAELPVEQSVALPLALRGVTRGARLSRARALLEATGLEDRRRALPAELSGGERQRVALCAALVHEPRLLLADEPTGELDGAGAQALLTLLAETARAAGIGAIIASHDPAGAGHADRTVTLSDGRIVDERLDAETALVVSPTGWLQLPATLRRRAQIGDRVRIAAEPGALVLTPANDRRSPAAARSRDVTAVAPPPWTPIDIELRGLRREFGRGRGARVVLDDLSHRFRPGALTAVTGRSGSGKTTLLRLLAGLDRPDSGQVVLDGRPLRGLDREQLASLRRTRIGWMGQDAQLVGFLTARENLALTLQLRGDASEAARASANEHLAGLGLAGRATHRASTLSAGERQRAGLARALVGARGLLIVDEPTSRLDRNNAAIVAGWLADAAASRNQTVICATHDPLLVAHADEELRLGGECIPAQRLVHP